jgi:LAO/AO transport system kinase
MLANWKDIPALASQVREGSTAALGRAITLIESNAPAHREPARRLLQTLMPHAGASVRIGISGPPGVGKSTFIDAFGIHLLEQGKLVAVLAVDPSSGRTGGSILGDKTRMYRLSMDHRAFVRPSPTSGTLGGVARRTRETMFICEAAGFDTIIVETVGVGQSEITVAQMVDMYLVLMLAGAGDELQGIKKGVLEWADLLAINKADGANATPAQRARRELAHALHYTRREKSAWTPLVRTCSAIEGEGIEEIWTDVLSYREAMQASGEWDHRRRTQGRDWMWSMIREGLEARFLATPEVADRFESVVEAVESGNTTASEAAEELLAMWEHSR